MVEENLVTLKIDDKEVKVKQGTTILQAAKQVNIDIPTLCFLKDINEVGDCRMCIVEVEGKKGFSTSCIQKVEEGMVVHTHSPTVMEARRVVLDLILSNHHRDCLTCARNGNCELQALAMKFNIHQVEFEGEMTEHKIDDKSPAIVRDFNKCILCRRCVATCKNVQGIGAIDCMNRGFESSISTVGNHSLNDVNCTFCGQCIESCPTGALREKENIKDVWRKLKDPEVYTVVQTAPSVRVALGEEFGMPIGTNVVGKMVAALKSLGFDKVFDTNTGADLTIMEEANEFIERFTNNDCLPMITSCCPGWVRFAEKDYPDLLDHLSSCKSPHQMFGAIVKSYYAKKYNIDSVESVMRGQDSILTGMPFQMPAMNLMNITGIYNLEDYTNAMIIKRNLNTLATDMDFYWDKPNRKLYVYANPNIPTQVTINFKPEYYSVADIRESYWETHLRKLALAMCKIVIGRIRSKYTSSSTKFQLDGPTILAEGREELQQERDFLQSNKDIFTVLN